MSIPASITPYLQGHELDTRYFTLPAVPAVGHSFAFDDRIWRVDHVRWVPSHAGDVDDIPEQTPDYWGVWRVEIGVSA
nr:hypothetical protein [Mycobacterium sp. UM_NZ2]